MRIRFVLDGAVSVIYSAPFFVIYKGELRMGFGVVFSSMGR